MRSMAEEEEEDLRTLLQRRERQTMNRLDFARITVERFEEELREIRTAMTALGLPTNSDPTETRFSGLSDDRTVSISGASAATGAGAVVTQSTNPLGADYLMPAEPAGFLNPTFLNPLNPLAAQVLSIKEMVLSVLRAGKRFRLYGATASQIRDAIKDNFNRDIARESLSPTLSRMRDDGLIEQAPGGHWTLAESRNALVNPRPKND
jgi:hypothetical protein